jgi:hypothetical protein
MEDPSCENSLYYTPETLKYKIWCRNCGGGTKSGKNISLPPMQKKKNKVKYIGIIKREASYAGTDLQAGAAENQR